MAERAGGSAYWKRFFFCPFFRKLMREKRLFIGPAELDEIRRGADWREVFRALGIERVNHPGGADDWWALSPFRRETRPSFHMNDRGFHCFSSGQGGGVIELVQQVLGVDCYAAGRWLVENGLSRSAGGKRPPPAAGRTGAGRRGGTKAKRPTEMAPGMGRTSRRSGKAAATGRSGRISCRFFRRSIRNSSGAGSRRRRRRISAAGICRRAGKARSAAGWFFRYGG